MDFIGREWDGYQRSAVAAWHAVGRAWAAAGAPVEIGATGYEVMHAAMPLVVAWACVAVVGAVVVVRR